MKGRFNYIFRAFCFIAASAFVFGCSASANGGMDSSQGDELIEIKDRLFIAQVTDVYANADDYMGKTIKLEGIFKQQPSLAGEAPYCFVIRNSPGCCGDDGTIGFEVAWPRDKGAPYPEIDAWVEAVGVVNTYKEDSDFEYVYLDLASLEVLDRRGLAFVSQ